jgi:biotin operon repressor
MAVSACIDELRDNGFAITCERRKNVWLYWLERKQEVSA